MAATTEESLGATISVPGRAVNANPPHHDSSASPSDPRHGNGDCASSNIADETSAQETLTQGQTTTIAPVPVQYQTCLSNEDRKTDKIVSMDDPMPEERGRLGPLRGIRARAASIGKRVYSVSLTHRRPQTQEQVGTQDHKKEPNTFMEILWSRLQHLRPSRTKRKKQNRTSNRAVSITLVDNDASTPENSQQQQQHHHHRHHHHHHGSDDDSDGNFSAIEIFDQEYSEERPGGKGLRMVRYIPRHEASGSSEGTSTGTAQDLIYVPYSPGSEQNEACGMNRRSSQS
ncbi:hypothetical protein KEM54_005765 [Ascosphaera aggregata]|nr:hypothetical protein KEM54_005765 [Ascosphaera aggregata]